MTEIGHAQPVGSLAQRAAPLVAKARASGTVRVVAKVPGTMGQAQMLNARASLEGQAQGFGAAAIKAVGRTPWVAMDVSEVVLNRLIASGQITEVVEDERLSADLANTIPQIGADLAHGAGVTGIVAPSQARIAVLDTGVDNDHDHLNVVAEACFSTTSAAQGSTSVCPGGVASSTATDSADGCTGAMVGVPGCDHGTHVAATAAGIYGVAPSADIIAIQVFSKYTDSGAVTPCASAGRSSPCSFVNLSDLVAALDHVLDRVADGYEISAVNMSVGGGLFSTVCDTNNALYEDTEEVAAQLAAHMGVVAAAGNFGSSTSISYPACLTSVIAVGNSMIYDNEVAAHLFCSTNYGPLLDLWAPGDNVVAAVPDDTVPRNATGMKCGTSMSSPHVAGALALLRQIDPTIPQADMLDLLQDTGVPVKELLSETVLPQPRIDVFAAVHQLSDTLTTAEASETFGQALATGDFNGDGTDDLAVGVKQDHGANDAVGGVDVFYGSPVGPGIVQVWNQTKFGGSQEANDDFGRALATGDFDNDSFDDLAIGAPLEDVGAIVDAGTVFIVYGSPTGLNASRTTYFSQDTSSVEGASETGDNFGAALAAGDFNNDGRDDLAIGVPFEDLTNVSNRADAGGVNVLYGSTSGLSATAIADQFWAQDQGPQDLQGAVEASDQFGSSLAAGDFNNDNRLDLAVGSPGEALTVGGVAYATAGGVNVIYGSATGLHGTTVANQWWDQDSLADAVEADDRFGSALATADFNNDGRDDLAIGVVGEDQNSAVTNSGGLNIVYGANASGLGLASNQFWVQGLFGINGAQGLSDQFGRALAAGDINNDGYADVVCGAPGETSLSGVAHVVYGSSTGIDPYTVLDKVWSQDSTDVLDASESSDYFGGSLAIGDYNGDGRNDLAIGAAGETLAQSLAGYVNVLFQASSGGVTGTGSTAVFE